MAAVCVVGSLNVDMGFRATNLPRPGETVLAADRTRTFGGKGGNQAIAAATCQATVSMVGAVGDDQDGTDYRAHLASYGIDVDGLATASGQATGCAVVLIDDRGENMIVVDPGANATVVGDAAVPHIQATEPAVLLAQLEVPVAAVEAIVAALPPTTTVVLNPAPMPPDPRALDRILPRVDILVPNRSELAALAGRQEPVTQDEVLECLHAVGRGRTVVATLGADGAAILEPDGNVAFLPTRKVDAIDSTGAGDAFCGCLAAEIAAGRTVRDSVVEALKVATYSTTLRGGQLPNRMGVS